MFGSIVALALPGLAMLVSVGSLWSAGQALRAKERLKVRIKLEAERDDVFRDHLRSARDTLTSDDLSDLQEILEKLTADMSETDRKAVERSLHQPSKEGERRYIKEMLSAV